MPVADLIIAIVIFVSVVVGAFRGFVKEAISVVTLVVAIWAALRFAPMGGSLVDHWVTSSGVQIWVGRLIVFLAVLLVGGILGWGLSKIVQASALSISDRVFGMVFGLARGVVLVGLLVMTGQYAGFKYDEWWGSSRLIPYGEQVAEMIKKVAPMGLELIQSEESVDDIPVPDEI